jgi:cell division cycle protein 37
MKVYVYFEGKQLIKTKLPSSWDEQECSKITQMFVDYYNNKNPGGELKMEDLQLTELKSGVVIPGSAKIADRIQPYADLQVVEMQETMAPVQNPWSSGTHVPLAARENVTTTKAAKGFSEAYNKWDRLECSDDERDFHPNIDNNLMIRLKREKRAERKKEEAKLVKQLEEEIAAGNEEATVKLEEFYKTRQLCGDDLCEVKDSRSMINSGPSDFEKTVAQKKEQEKSGVPRSEKDEEREYADFQAQHMDAIEEYAKMSVENSEDYILERPNLLQTEAAGHLLIHMLELEMNGKRAEMKVAVRQYLMLQNIVDLSKQVDRDPRSSVRPFFREIQQPDKLEALGLETEAFADKIIARAIVKKQEQEERIAAMQEEGADEEEYEEVPYEERLGPGGLDPVEVFPTLPDVLQEAFSSKDVEALQRALQEMSQEQAQYHMKRMVDSGLWVPQGGADAGS